MLVFTIIFIIFARHIHRPKQSPLLLLLFFQHNVTFILTLSFDNHQKKSHFSQWKSHLNAYIRSFHVGKSIKQRIHIFI